MSETGTNLLHWQYMIFLLPMGLAALFLVLSSLRIGRHGHRGQGNNNGHSGHGHRGHGGGTKATGKTGHGHKPLSVTPVSLLLVLIGADKAPLPLAIEMFCLSWGIVGFWANRQFLGDSNGSVMLVQMIPSLSMALMGGVVGARVASELAVRLMPRDESTVISRNSLFGLPGKVVFAASETSGRIHVYDEHGTLHDEMCRVADGQETIAKGTRVMVVDRDGKGRLIVEEWPSA